MASESPVMGEAQQTALLCPHHLATLHCSPNGSTKRTSAQKAPGGCRFPAQPAHQCVLRGHQSGLLTALLVEPQPQARPAPGAPGACRPWEPGFTCETG